MRLALIIFVALTCAPLAADALHDAPSAMALIRSRVRDHYRAKGVRLDLRLDELIEPEMLDETNYDRTNFGFFVKSLEPPVCCIYYRRLRPGDLRGDFAWELDLERNSLMWLDPVPPDLPGFGTWPDNPELAAAREKRNRARWAQQLAEDGATTALHGLPLLALVAAATLVFLGRRRRRAALAGAAVACSALGGGFVLVASPWGGERALFALGLVALAGNLGCALVGLQVWVNLRFPAGKRRAPKPLEFAFKYLTRLPTRRS